ncbi:hypothetical protein [Nocardia nepalensis]|uniref:hypothetical protein n=1 Tax=Nocardia nepalensis TaxID=3375448 RepID=UPI003B6747BC
MSAPKPPLSYEARLTGIVVFFGLAPLVAGWTRDDSIGWVALWAVVVVLLSVAAGAAVWSWQRR